MSQADWVLRFYQCLFLAVPPFLEMEDTKSPSPPLGPFVCNQQESEYPGREKIVKRVSCLVIDGSGQHKPWQRLGCLCGRVPAFRAKSMHSLSDLVSPLGTFQGKLMDMPYCICTHSCTYTLHSPAFAFIITSLLACHAPGILLLSVYQRMMERQSGNHPVG